MKKITILFVFDEKALQEAVKASLEKAGLYTVTTVSSAIEAIWLLVNTSFDGIISDYQMPDMDALEFLKIIRASGDTTPFIISAGRGREEVAIDAFDSGADGCVQKGEVPDVLFAALQDKWQGLLL